MNQESNTVKQAIHDVTDEPTEDEIIGHAIVTYGFLIPRKTTYTSQQFANAMQAYSTSTRTWRISLVIEASNRFYEHSIDGTYIIHKPEEEI